MQGQMLTYYATLAARFSQERDKLVAKFPDLRSRLHGDPKDPTQVALRAAVAADTLVPHVGCGHARCREIIMGAVAYALVTEFTIEPEVARLIFDAGVGDGGAAIARAGQYPRLQRYMILAAKPENHFKILDKMSARATAHELQKKAAADAGMVWPPTSRGPKWIN